MIPRRTIDALRTFNDVSVDIYGIDCDLYVPSAVVLNTEETFDIYGEDSQMPSYTHYAAKVWIEWSPEGRRLRKYGLDMEKEVPILARFAEQAINDSLVEVNVDITIHSYIKVATEYVPNNVSDTDEFEMVDILVGNMHDAIVSKIYKLAPRRVAPISGS
jgi:hypothetical protein